MSAVKNWLVGRRVVSLRENGSVLIAESVEDRSGLLPVSDTVQFTLATGLSGLLGLIETLQEVAEEVKARRGK